MRKVVDGGKVVREELVLGERQSTIESEPDDSESETSDEEVKKQINFSEADEGYPRVVDATAGDAGTHVEWRGEVADSDEAPAPKHTGTKVRMLLGSWGGEQRDLTNQAGAQSLEIEVVPRTQ